MKDSKVIATAGTFSTRKGSVIVPSLALAIVVLAGQVDAQTGSSLTEQEKAAYLKVHSDARREIGSPPLEWDTRLATEAQRFADHLASTGLFEHASKIPGWERDLGENLAANSDDNPAKKAAEQWFAEKAAFQRLGTNGKLSAAHVDDYEIFKDIGHYTQMVWQDTTKAGAGKARYKSGPRKGAWVVVGKYFPVGNYTDQYAYGTPNSSSPANSTGPGGGPQTQMNPTQGPDKSTYTQGDAMVTVEVTNKTGQPVACEWVNYDGKAEPHAQIPTAGITLHSYPGNLYRFRVGATTTSYRASRNPVQHFSIGSPAKDAGPRGSAKATPPWAATQIKSTYKQGDPWVTISVTNKTGQDLEFLWVDGNGKETQPAGVIRAGAKNHPMGTSYPGSLYRFKLDGKLFHSWVIQKDHTHLTIGSPVNNAGPLHPTRVDNESGSTLAP